MQQRAGAAGSAFFGRTYDEARLLLEQARDWLRDSGPAAARGLEPVAALAFAHESLRLTVRITQMMAWLMAQRAAHAGEISREELRDPAWRLGARELCLAPPPPAAEALPAEMRALLERSEKLYLRVARLDDLVARGAA